ncbi:peptide/nickel transport system substrate-binding protein [Antricoccus suffuscus]|uniref:Peptide/nickel transport system substrate-binding protein n=1 Tax=Antricoccus suffuscus TaxID=1629062 RepID=A0A2T0ZUD2_9ACTN|nr:ABC transporter substrate-binding protein [Antricoccus suffuscus]PRZ39698.1 peptide/nickel transport system substrate-binding protein [Antricoccus suffuscus]
MRRVILCLLVAALVGSLTACGSDDKKDGTSSVAPGTGKTVRWGTSTLPTTFDPATVGSATHIVYFGLIYDTLIHTDTNGVLTPMLATDWKLSSDGMSLDMTLRDGVKFQDGSTFDAKAAVSNFDYMRSDKSLVANSLAMVKSVEATGPLALKFMMSRPGGDLPGLLAGLAGMMSSPASLAAGTNATKPVGAGPFKIGTISNAKVTFTYWDGYWNAKDIVPRSVEVSFIADDAARLNALKSGQLDIAISRASQIPEAEAAGLEHFEIPAATAYAVQLNATQPGLDNPDVRRAISMAIDREGINKTLGNGICSITAQPYNDKYWAHDKTIDEKPYLKHDVAAAKALVAKNAPDLSLTILAPNITVYQHLAEVVQGDLSKIGISAKVNAIDYVDLTTRSLKGDYQMVVTLTTPGSPDPASWESKYFKLSPVSDVYLDPKIPEYLAESYLSADPKLRATAIGKATNAALEAGTNQITICVPPNTWLGAAGLTGFASNDPRHVLVK